MTKKQKEQLLEEIESVLRIGNMFHNDFLKQSQVGTEEKATQYYNDYREFVHTANALFDVANKIFKIPANEILEYGKIQECVTDLHLQECFTEQNF